MTRPLTLDELVALPDEPASGAMPPEVREQLTRGRAYVTRSPGDAEGFRTAEAGEGWELDLPEGTFLGRPGRTGERLDRPARAAADEVSGTEPFRPEWMAASPVAKPAAPAADHAPLTRANGRLVEPYYGVYGADDRQVYYPDAHPWSLTGRIFTWTNWAGGGGWSWAGSGVLVGPRHVLTAGHVCPWGAPSWAMRFVPAYWNGASVFGAGSESYASDYRGWNTNNTVSAWDFAVLRLYEPLGSGLGWMGTKVYDPGWQGGAYWNLTGYPGMVAGAERPSYQSRIPVLHHDVDGDAMELEHHGDATAGDSGGPFWATWPDGPYAVGATSGGEIESGGEDNNVEAGGRAMVDLVRWALTTWP